MGLESAPEEQLLFSCCSDGQELETEKSCLFAEAHLGSPLCLFIATVEDGFSVRFLGR